MDYNLKGTNVSNMANQKMPGKHLLEESNK